MEATETMIAERRKRLVQQPAVPTGAQRFAMLDGWRALSILLVLAAHLLPLGPARMGMNLAFAQMGMALFFTLSGFLITRALAQSADLRVFVIRRFFRIVPLAWAGSVLALLMVGADLATYRAYLLFYANIPPFWMVVTASHLWSLCVEMQFYVCIAALVAIGGQRALYALPLICLIVTGLRFATGTHVSIVTWLRVDEILAGGVLGLAYAGWFGRWPVRLLRRGNVYLLIALLLVASMDASGGFAYLRPYLAAATVGVSLVNAPPWLSRISEGRAARYIATISYALYIIHGVLRMTWLGTEPFRYLKRPLLFAATFGLAHISTFHFEARFIAIGKRLTRRAPRRHHR